MGNVIMGAAMSLDGFINDANGSMERLSENFEAAMQSDVMQEAIRDTGAVVMGRHAYELGNGDYTGYEFQVPIFVVTHDASLAIAKGTNDKLSFTFVTEGVESAVAQAKAAAGDKDVTIIGTASVGIQCLKAGLVDFLEVYMTPVLLGGGLRFFDAVEAPIQLEQTRVVEMAGRTYLRYRVVK
jgi:dihydrofolate reductase